MQASGRDGRSPCTKRTSRPQLGIMAHCPPASSSVLLCMECPGSLPNCPCDFLGPRILPHLPSTASHTNSRDTGQPHSRQRKAWGASHKTAAAPLFSVCGDSKLLSWDCSYHWTEATAGLKQLTSPLFCISLPQSGRLGGRSSVPVVKSICLPQ